jgi:hypothetical protein
MIHHLPLFAGTIFARSGGCNLIGGVSVKTGRYLTLLWSNFQSLILESISHLTVMLSVLSVANRCLKNMLRFMVIMLFAQQLVTCDLLGYKNLPGLFASGKILVDLFLNLGYIFNN